MTPSFTSLAPPNQSTSGSNPVHASSSTNTTNPNLGPSPSDALAAEKVEAIGIEYSYLLTSQLDSQRAFYEDQQRGLERQLVSAEEMISLLRASTPDPNIISTLEERAVVAEERAAKAESRLEKSLQLTRRFEKDLKEERTVSEGLMTTIADLRGKVDLAEKDRERMKGEMAEMSDQLRDVMFYLQTRDKIESSAAATTAENIDGEGTGGNASATLGEAAGGSISIVTNDPTPTSASAKKKGKKKK